MPKSPGRRLPLSLLLALACVACQPAAPATANDGSTASATAAVPAPSVAPAMAAAMPAAPAATTPPVEPPPAAAAETVADTGADPQADTAFNVADVPESGVALPPFPLLQAPDGLVSRMAKPDQTRAFDREHMIAGDAVIAVEGKVFRDRFRLTGGARDYSDIEFQRNYRDAVTALGGVEVSQVQYTPAVNAAFGGRAAIDRHYHGTCASHGCENHTYVIRQDDREYWLQVSTGAIPLHGQVTVLERAAMASALKLVTAGEMQRALDATGMVALQINFDTDRATLRADAQPLVAQIVALLRNDPALHLSIEGHTDNVGDAGHNRELSDQRAEAVVAALVAAGIDPPRLDGVGYGAERPVADNASAAGRARNRRVELHRVDPAG